MNPTSDEGQTPNPAKRGGGLTARAIVHAVARRPVTLFGITVLAAGLGAAVWFYLPLPKTTVSTVFHVSQQAPILLNATAESRVDFGSYRQSQVALVKRRLTLNSVLKQPAVQNLEVVRKQSDPLLWLDNSVQVEFRSSAELMRVSLEGNNADELRVILDALGKAYLADVDDRDNGVRRRRLAKLEETNRAYRTELERFHKRIDTVALALGSKDGPTLAIIDSLLKDELRSAVRELTLTRDQLQWADIEAASAAAKAPANVPPGGGAADKAAPDPVPPGGPEKARPEPDAVVISPVQLDEEMRRDAGLRELEAAVSLARQTLTRTKALFQAGEQAPAVVKAEEDLKSAELKRDKYRDELRPLIEKSIRREIALREEARLAALGAAADTLKKREAQAKAKVASVQQSIAKSNDYRIELENINLLIGQTERLSARLADEIAQITIELGAPPRVTLAEEPYAVPGIEGNRRLKYALMAALGVFFAGSAAVVMWEHRSRRLTHPDDVSAALGIRLIGSVPVASSDTGSVPPPVLVEAIDATRTMLLSGAHDPDLRVIVVTSAVSGEGKTSLTGHLAISLARAGFRTLLIDGDLRAPTAQRVFGLTLAPGLCEVLHGKVDAAAAVWPTGVTGLSVMTAGEWSQVTHQAFVGSGWRVLKDQLKAEYDFIVVDTSPLLLVSDTLLMAREADGVVVSVLMGSSRVALVEEAVHRLQRVRAKVVGVIANGVRAATHGYGYDYGYGTPPAPVQAEALPETPAR